MKRARQNLEHSKPAATHPIPGLGEDLETPFSASSDLEQILSSEPAAEAEAPAEE